MNNYNVNNVILKILLKTMFVGYRIGNETLKLELKEFSKDKNAPIEYSDIELNNIFNKGSINKNKFHNDLVYILNNCIDLYVPKYVSSIINSNLKQEAKLIIGANDKGYVTGVHSYDNLTSKKIKDIILQRCKHLLQFEKHKVEQYLKNMKINVTKLKQKQRFTTYIDLMIKNKKRQIEIEEIEYDIYMELENLWHQKRYHYSQKLEDILNNPYDRLMLIQYIKRNIEESERHLFEHFVDLLTIEEYIPIIKNEEFRMGKYDPHSIYHWIIRYKDDMMFKLLSNRPTKVKRPQTMKSFYRTEFYKLTNIVPKLIKNDNTLNSYLIEIIIHPIKDKTKYSIDNGNSWIYQKRIILNGEPQTTYIFESNVE